MDFVQRKATTSKSKEQPYDFLEKKKEFLSSVFETVVMELILNWDRTSLKLVPSSTWTMERQGSKRVEMIGVNDKRQITAVFCGSLIGEFLPLQLIYEGKTARCLPRFTFPAEWDITCSPKHWSTEKTMFQYFHNITLPYIESVRERVGDNKAAVVILDNFKGQVTPSFLQLLEDNNIHTCFIPPNTTDHLQSMDISVNKPAKDFLKHQFNEWYSAQVIKQLEAHDLDDLEAVDLEPINLSLAALKEISGKWFVDMANYLMDNPQFIVNGFLQAGISQALDGNDEEMESNEGDSEDNIDNDDDFDNSDDYDSY